MRKGRLTKEEQIYRIGMLIRFIFTFSYATREQLDEFSQKRLGLSCSRRLIGYSIGEGFITTYDSPMLGLKVYYLTQKGQAFLYRHEPFSRHYHFGDRNTGFNTFEHQKAVIESYHILYKQLAIKEWIPEWVVRKNLKTRDKIPDAVIVMDSSIKIALEVETCYKQREEWKTIVYEYKDEMNFTFSDPRYNVILIIAYSNSNYEGIKNRLFYIKPEFSRDAFMLVDLNLLQAGECFYQDKIRLIKDVLGERRFDEERKAYQRGTN